MIEVQELTKSFGETRAVRGVSFSIERGEVVGLLGPNGAGKSTTMRMLTTYLEPDSGDAVVCGHRISDAPDAVRAQIGYLPESAPLYLEMTIRPYLAYLGGLRGLRGARRRERIETMIDLCGLRDVLDRELGQLSRGYRQRVGIAATLIHEPPFLILDEPTSGLDPNQIVDIRRLIRDVAQETTVMLSTHILPEVEATCDRVVVIAEGSVRFDGATAEFAGARSERAEVRIGLRSRDGQQDALAALPGVLEVTPLERRDGASLFRLRAEGDDVPERLFAWAVAQGETLVELVEERRSLEDAFAEITQADEAAAVPDADTASEEETT